MLKVLPLLFLVLLLLYFSNKINPAGKTGVKNSQPTPVMIQITSNSITDGGLIPKKYTCDGDNINPPLTIKNVPEKTLSLALIVDDPDAPLGTWNHWLIWNIPATTGEIKEDSVPAGAVAGTNSFGRENYGGPCPPSGTHRYFFRIYALDTRLKLSPDTDRAGLEDAINQHLLGRGELLGKYSRD